MLLRLKNLGQAPFGNTLTHLLPVVNSFLFQMALVEEVRIQIGDLGLLHLGTTRCFEFLLMSQNQIWEWVG